MNEKVSMKQTTQIRMSSRGSSRKSYGRLYSPANNAVKEVNMSDIKKFFDSTPKSLNGDVRTLYMTKAEEIKSPIYRRRLNDTEFKANATELKISYSPANSDDGRMSDTDSVKYSDISGIRSDHPYFNRRNGPKVRPQFRISKPTKHIRDLKPSNFTNHIGIGSNFPFLQNQTQDKNSPKTSFEVQPVVPKSSSMVMGKNGFGAERNSKQ